MSATGTNTNVGRAHSKWRERTLQDSRYQYAKPEEKSSDGREKESGKLYSTTSTPSSSFNFDMPALPSLVIWLLIAGVIGLVAYFIIKRGYDGRFRNPGIASERGQKVEDMTSETIGDELEKAIQANDYRLAIRFLYLKCLSELQEAKYIVWKKYSTNSEYIHQVRDTRFAQPLSMATTAYEVYWYGEREVNEDLYLECRPAFDEILLHAQVNTRVDA